MAGIKDTVDNASDNMEDTKDKAKNIASRHPVRFGTATMVAIFGTGYLVGQKRAESQSMYHKLIRTLK